MSTIINGNFQDSLAAKRAVAELLSAGFIAEQTSSFLVNLPGHQSDGQAAPASEIATEAAAQEGADGALTGAAVGSAIGVAVALATMPILGPVVAVAAVGVGAYGGSLYGALGSMDAANDIAAEAATLAKQEARHRQSGTLVAVIANNSVLQDTAKQILHANGAADIERREGVLRDSKWTDFDPHLPLLLFPT